MRMKIQSNKIIIGAVRETGTITGAAAKLGITRQSIYKHIRKSKTLKTEIEAILNKEQEKKKERRRVRAELNAGVGISLRETSTGKLISEKMREIINSERGEHTSVFNLVIDQLSMREMMEKVKYQHCGILKEGEKRMPLEDYVSIMSDLHLNYARITKAAEEIALKKLGDKTQAEIYDNVFNFTNLVIETFKELINDQSIDRRDIIKMFTERIKIGIDEG
jgi:predicted DNA-binding protein YlxM (UPF0122 family)